MVCHVRLIKFIRIAPCMPIFGYFVFKVLWDLSRKKRPRKVIVLQYCKYFFVLSNMYYRIAIATVNDSRLSC